MQVLRTAMYSRTQNENGSFNTRCLDCFMTIGFAVESELELDEIEVRHLCPERVLSELFRRAAEQETLKRAAGF